MTARETAAYLGVSVDTLRRLACGGHVPSWPDPDTGWRRYSKPAVDRWLQANCPGVEQMTRLHRDTQEPDGERQPERTEDQGEVQ